MSDNKIKLIWQPAKGTCCRRAHISVTETLFIESQCHGVASSCRSCFTVAWKLQQSLQGYICECASECRAHIYCGILC